LYTANRERALAQRRFMQVRQLANKVLGLDAAIRGLPGSTKARHEIVAISEEYLEALSAGAHADKNLALEVGAAYSQLARVQGVPYSANLGQYVQAEESLRKADAMLEPVLAASPRDRKALGLSAEVAHDRMILADAGHRRDEALAQARKAAARLDTLLDLGAASQSEMSTAAQLFSNIALAYKNMHRYDDAIRYARRSMDVSRLLPSAQAFRGIALSVLADSMRFSGDLEGALRTIRAARSDMESAHFLTETSRRSSLFNVLWREGVILGQDGGVNLDQPGEAVAALQKALDLTEEWARKDPNDASCRILAASAARELGAILRHGNPQRALEAYDLGLRRLGEIKGNVKARRDEARMLAGSSYALRLLSRGGEAKDRIDSALRLLRETKDYPADRIDPDNEATVALRALGDHLGETGQPGRAAEVYRELLDKIKAWKPDPLNDLRQATELSGIYEALGSLERRSGRRDAAENLSSLRLELWRHWDGKLPHNSFVHRQLEAARIL
jgi:serine/threonine-protein kinase